MPDLRKLTTEHMAIVARVRELYPEENDANLADTIEGLSDIKEAIAATIRLAQECDAMAEGLATYMDELNIRCQRLKARRDSLKAAALQAAIDTDNRKVVAVDFTASVSPGKRKVVITGDVPDTFCRIKKEPNKTAIQDAMEAGVKLPFAEWSNATPYLTVRTK